MADNEMKIIEKAKNLAVHTFRVTSNVERYPKKYRHSLVDKIQVKSLEIYENLLEANTINDITHPTLRYEMITKAITYCNELNFFIELSKTLNLISGDATKFWSTQVIDVKRMALAWRAGKH